MIVFHRNVLEFLKPWTWKTCVPHLLVTLLRLAFYHPSNWIKLRRFVWRASAACLAIYLVAEEYIAWSSWNAGGWTTMDENRTQRCWDERYFNKLRISLYFWGKDNTAIIRSNAVLSQFSLKNPQGIFILLAKMTPKSLLDLTPPGNILPAVLRNYADSWTINPHISRIPICCINGHRG